MEHTDGLEIFVAITQAGGLSAAARELGTSRAALTRRLDGLEARLGVRLLHRSTRSVTLTAAGEELFRRTKPLVEAAREATRAVQAVSEEPRGVLRVAAPPSIPGVDLSPLFVSFAAKYPLVELIVEQSSRYVDLRGEQIDVALRGGPVGDDTLLARRLQRSELVAVASPDYLRDHPAPLQPADLVDHILILGFAEGAQPERRWPLSDGTLVPVHGRLASNDLQLRVAYALAGQGITRLPLGFVRAHIDAGRLVEVLPEQLRVASHLHLVWTEREYVQRKVLAFVDHATAWYQAVAPTPLQARSPK